MVDGISDKIQQSTAGMVARLKVGGQSLESSIGPTRAEQRLSDIVDIDAGVQEQVQKTRKLESLLRLSGSVIRYFTGASAKTYTPLYSSVEIEYVRLENPYIAKTDKTA